MSLLPAMSDPSELRPWHRQAWEELIAADRRGKLGHALLLSAAPGTGLRAFAGCLVSYLLNLPQHRDIDPAERVHPDLLWLRREQVEEDGVPKKVRKWILAAQMQTLRTYLVNHPVGRRKLAVIELAEHLNRYAANALLKSLEEPVPDTYIVLLSHAPGRLPPTVLSRCTRISLARPGPSSSLAWLSTRCASGPETEAAFWLTGEAPQGVLDLLAGRDFSILLQAIPGLTRTLENRRFDAELARRLGVLDGAMVNTCCQRWLVAALTAVLTKDSGHLQRGQDFLGPAQVLRELSSDQLVALYDHCQRQRLMLTDLANPNPASLLDNLLILWIRTLRTRTNSKHSNV